MSELASHPLLWRGMQVSHRIPALGTGHAVLDEVLPGSGWPLGAVTELVNDTDGCGELSLLLPVLARLSQENQWISMIDPPWIPYPPALHGHGLALEKLLLIRTQNRDESLWACEQVVRGISGGAVLAWPDTLTFAEVRRLQLAAERTQKNVFLFNDRKAANTASPAALRLELKADDGDLQISVLKCRGKRSASGIRIRQSQLFQPQALSPVNSSDSDKNPGSLSESPVASLATSRTCRPSL